MGEKGLDFKHKEVINISNAKRLRICTRCNGRLKNWHYNIYDGCKKENIYKYWNNDISENIEEAKYLKFVFKRERKKKDYITKKNQKRTGYILKEKFIYDVICKVEL